MQPLRGLNVIDLSRIFAVVVRNAETEQTVT